MVIPVKQSNPKTKTAMCLFMSKAIPNSKFRIVETRHGRVTRQLHSRYGQRNVMQCRRGVDFARNWRVDLRSIDAKGVGKIGEVLLLLNDDVAQDFAKSELAHRFRLAGTLAVVFDCDALVLEVELKHLLGVRGSFDLF